MKHVLSLLLAGALTAASLSAQTLSWTKRDPKVNSAVTMNAVTFGADKYVAVGYRGTSTGGIENQVTSSADGATWTAGPNLPTNGAVRSIAYGGGLFAVPIESNSETSLILTSPDAVTWTARATGAGQLSSIAYGNGVATGGGTTPMWIAVGSANGGNNIVRSTDGITWTRVNTGRTIDLWKVAHGRNVFLAIARSGTLLSSSNGTTWNAVTVPNLPAGATFLGITFDGTEFLLLVNDGARNPQVYVSGDGSAWAAAGSKLTSASLFDGTVAGNGSLVAVAGASSVSGNVVFTAPITPGLFATVGAWSNAQVVDANSFGFVFITHVNSLWVAGGYDAALYTAAGTGGGGGGTTTPAPVVTTPPAAQTATLGGSATFSVTASGTGNTYQWLFNNAPIAGATSATYTIAAVTAANAGAYAVRITNAGGTANSTAATLTIATAATRGRLINLSVLTTLSTATDEFTLGYVVGGTSTTGSKPLVIRAAGPSLGALGVPGTIADPQLETFAGSTRTGGNDNWGGASALAADLAAVGAFAYIGPTSRDAAVSTSISSRDNSVKVTGVAGATGQVIAEVYDATPSANFAATTPRLLNVSVRKHLGTGITAGFVLGGSAPTRVLIRVVGPGLAAFGVGDTVVDPQLALFNDKSVKIGENNDWGGSAELAAAFTSVGAFALPAATSKDAALLVTLQPGLYSVQASGVNNTTGVGIVEVYELP